MSDLVKMVIIALLVAAALAVVLTILPKEPPNQVLIPIEPVNAAVIRFEDRSGVGTLGEEMRIRLEGELVNRLGIQVFSRERLDVILQEQRLCALGLCDPQTAVQVGHLIGVNKLITGVILKVDQSVGETQICKEIQLWPPGCSKSVPGTEVKVEMEIQFQILNAQTGRIEASERISGSASEAVEKGQGLPDSAKLLRSAMDVLSSRIADRIQMGYTRELRYGLYKGYKPKGNAYEGEGLTNTFTTADEQVVLLVHLVRMQPGDHFNVVWVDPQGQRMESQAVSGDAGWVPFTLPLLGKPAGTWTVEGYLNGQKVFTDTFIVMSL